MNRHPKSAMPLPACAAAACLAAACLAWPATSALAEELPPQDSDRLPAAEVAAARPKLPLWEAGLFGFDYTQPAYPGAEDRTSRALVLPYLVYRGKYLVAERGSIGVRALKTTRVEADVGFAASLGSASSDIPARQGMPNLGTLIEFGPRLKVNLSVSASDRSRSYLQLPLRLVIDVSHDFQSRGIAFEPQWVRDTLLPGYWFISTSLGAKFGDHRLNDTFYGVDPSEALPDRPAYAARAGLISLRAGLFAAHPLSRDVRVFCTLRFESLTGSANRDSPLVRRNSGWSAGIGLSWALSRSKLSAID